MKPVVLDEWMHGINHPSFGVEVFGNNLRHIYSIPLIKLHAISGNNGCEINLSGGRFKNYCDHTQPYKVIIKQYNHSLEDIQKNMLLFLDWIYNNISEYWSLDVEASDTNHLKLVFSFSEDVQAVIFRFLFQ